MRKTNLFILSLVLLLGCFFSNNLMAQNNQLKGYVKLSQEKKKKRISRGASYRDRIKNNQKGKSASEEKNKSNNIVISIHPTSFKATVAPLKDVFLYQEDKSFSPSVLPITKGTTVYFINKDDFYHNVFSRTPKARFDIGRKPAGDKVGQKIKKAGTIKVFCDIHPQMKATIISLDTPYFTVAKSDGSYHVKNLPDGTYTIKVHHSKMKSKSFEVSLQDGKTVNKDLAINTNSSLPTIDQTLLLKAESLSCHEIQASCKSKERFNNK